jgi:hypothetical protein
MGQSKQTVELGDEAQDVISGLSGVATGKAEYLTGCTQFSLSQRKLTKDGGLADAVWLDESRLLVVKKQAIKLSVAASSPGGPQLSAPRGRK